MNKKITAIGLTAGLIAGAGAGFLIESSGNAGASDKGTIVAAAAGVTANSTDTSDTTGTAGTSTAPTADRAARLQSVLQPLVDDGTLTQDQADKVIAALQAAGPMGGGPGRHGDGDGNGGHGPGFGRGAGLDEVATLLGITTDDVQTALQGGQTLAQIAVANGKTAQDVIDLLVADITQHFADEVASGEHTQAEADQMIAAVTQQITDAVNNGGPIGGGPGRHGDGDGDGDHVGFPGDDGSNGSGDSGTGGTIDGGPSDSPTTSTGA